MIHIDLIYLSTISILAPTVLGAALFKTLPTELRILAVFIFVTCLLEALTYVASLLYVNNLAVFHVFTYIEFGCISLIYFSLFRKVRIVRYAILTIATVFITLSIYILFKWEYFDSYNSLQRGLEHIIILIYVILFLWLFSQRLPEERLLLKPYFILSCGFFIYFSGTFLVFLDANRYVEFNNFFNWSVHSVLNIFLNAIYFSVLWTGGKMAKSK